MSIHRVIISVCLVIVVLLISGCYPYLFGLEFKPIDKGDIVFGLGGYQINVSIRVPDYDMKDSLGHKSIYYDYSFLFETIYNGVTADSAIIDSIPIIVLDSAFTSVQSDFELTKLNLRYLLHEIGETPDSTELRFKNQRWYGPKFLGNQEFHRNVEAITLSFKAILKDRQTRNITKSERFEVDLYRFNNRSWIFAK